MKKSITITEGNLRKIIESVIAEAGFRKFGYSKKATDPNAPRKGRIQVDHCKLEKARSAATGQEKEYIAVYLGHVFGDGAQKLVNAINSSVPQTVLNAALTEKGRSKVVLRVNIERKEEIPQVVSQLQSAITSLSDYDDTSIQNLCDSIYDAVDGVATSGDIESAEKNKIGNWRDMMKRLEDPEVRKQLLMYQTTNDYARQYGHVLSANNVMNILSQCPTASFVTERSTWLKKFHRRVNPGAQRIVVTKASSMTDYKKLDDAARAAGYQDFKDAKLQSGNSTQVINKIRIMANQGSNTSFEKVIMYDVRDTTPIDPNHDIWTEKIGLSNNLTGELNQAAAEFDQGLTGANSDTMKANKEKIDLAQKNAMPSRRAAMEKICRTNPWGAQIDVASFSNLSDADFIARTTYQLVKESAATQFGLVTQGDIERLASLCTIAVCTSSGIDLNTLQTRLFAPKSISDEDAMNAFTICDKIIPRLSNAVRSQNINMVKQESVNRERGKMNERSNGMMSLGQFINMAKQKYGVMPPEEDGDVMEATEAINRIVNEEIQKLVNRRNRK